MNRRKLLRSPGWWYVTEEKGMKENKSTAVKKKKERSLKRYNAEIRSTNNILLKVSCKISEKSPK
jgi:hypothetical protein